MTTICPVCGTTATTTETIIPPNEPVRVVDGADTWLVPCPIHDAPEVAEALAGFQGADGKPLVIADEVPA